MATAKDFTGMTIGRLFVVGNLPNETIHRMWLVRCSCGTEKKMRAHALNTGTLSCGCLRAEKARIRLRAMRTKHGASRESWFETWSGMMKRCYNTSTERWPNYGGRGIRVCERWHDPWMFFEDMGPRPSGASIDRINNDGDYEPGNCRWADARMQASNTTRNHWLEFNGVKDTIAGWERRIGVRGPTIRKRLKDGWSVERALSTPAITGAAKAAHLNRR